MVALLPPEEALPQEPVGILQGGKLRGNEQDPPLRDEKEIEDMVCCTCSQVKDDVVSVQGPSW